MANVNINVFRVAEADKVAFYTQDSLTQNQTITSSAASQVTTIATTFKARYIRIASDGNVWVQFGTAPTAVSGQGRLILAGVPEVLLVPVGTKVAVIN